MPYADNDGLKIHYEVIGKGPPLIMVPGLAGANTAWHENGYINELQDVFTLIPTEPRGIGKSSKPHDPEAYEYQNLASDIVSVIDDMGLEKAHYLGYSYGAELGYAIAILTPNRFRSFILGGGNPTDEMLNRSRSTWQETFKQGLEPFLEACTRLFKPVWTDALEKMYSNNDAKALYAYNSLRAVHNFDKKLDNLKVPCMVYAGDEDDWMDGVREIVEPNPSIRYVLLEGGGNHFEAFYRPDLLKPHLIQFIKDYGFI
jgi:pimeloyl-ACP methyl ester carboxylesterase